MAEFQIDKILISMLVVTGLFITVGIYLADLNDKYDINGYYTQNLSSYTSTYNNIKEDTEQVSSAVESISSGNLLDIVGGLLQSGINIFSIFFDSFVGIGFMFAESFDVFNLGTVGAVWSGIAVVVVTLVFVFFLLKKMTRN